MYYVDTNIFALAATDISEDGAIARYFLNTLSGEREAFTSCLTIDEVVWAVRRKKGMAEGIATARALLENPHLHLLPADEKITREALNIMEELNLHPRDALHVATMRANGLTQIVSSDSDFNRVPGIKRIDLHQLTNK